MDRLDGMSLFVRVAETGSLSRAARAAGVAQSTVSKTLAALERRMGVQLVRRTPRGMSLTEEGKDYYESLVPLLAELEAAETRVGTGNSSPSGLLRVASSAGLGRLYVVPRLPEFFERYPNIDIDFDISERYVSLTEERIDVAIRIGRLTDSTLTARKIGSTDLATVATDTYLKLHGEPQTPQDLQRHQCVTFMFCGTPRHWRFSGPEGEIVLAPKGRVRSNDAEHVRMAVLANIGVSHLPSWLFARELDSGAVSRVLTRFAPPVFPIHAVSRAGRLLPGKTRVFVDFLTEIFNADPLLKPR